MPPTPRRQSARKAAAEAEAPEVTEEVTRGRARQRLGVILNEDEQIQKLRDLVDEALKLNGTAWAYCPNCRKKLQVEVPDVKGRIDAAIKLLEQAEGKPKEEGDAGITIVVKRPAR